MTQLTIEQFGEALLKTGDLDPVYITLCATSMTPEQKWRLCVAYWCFYHLGVASYIAESRDNKQFRLRMSQAAAYSPTSAPPGAQPWPRGSERRHFRGLQSIKAVDELLNKYKDAHNMVLGLTGGPLGATYESVARAAQSHRGFGEWIAFKVADMAERVLHYDVDFSNCHLGIYKDPRQGAAVAWVKKVAESSQFPDVMKYQDRPWDYPISDDELSRMVQHYVWYFGKKFKAPGGRDRKVNVQEVETIFCKYKSHLKGHYPLGKDTREISHGLEGWGDLAQELRRNLPKAV